MKSIATGLVYPQDFSGKVLVRPNGTDAHDGSIESLHRTITENVTGHFFLALEARL